MTMNDPYRKSTLPEEPMNDSPEAILADTLRRLNNVEEHDAKRIVRALAAFMGFNVRCLKGEEAGYVDDEEDDSEA